MTRTYFGTDGIRGRVGVAPVTPDFVLRLGYAAGKVLAHGEQHTQSGGHPTVLIGKDTRISGYMLEAALEAGFSAAGVDVTLAGPLPTPGVAYLTRTLRLSAGVVISASHNPYDDNGIKFFSADGNKLPDEVERAIERSCNARSIARPPDSWGKRAGSMTRLAVTSNSAKAPFRPSVICMASDWWSIARMARPIILRRTSSMNSAQK